MRSALRLLLIPAVLGACAGSLDKRVALHPQAAGVELTTGHAEGCQSLGDVVGSASVEGDQDQATLDARNDLRNKAAALGATRVELQTSGGGKRPGMWRARYEVSLSGVAYRCPK